MRNREDYTDEEWSRICSENMNLTLKIMYYLDSLNYDAVTEEDAYNIIQENHIDISGFTLPYGCKTMAEWKKKIDEHNSLQQKASMKMSDIYRPDVTR